MRTIVLAVVLSVAQTSAPVPRKAPNSATSASKQIEKQPSNNEKPADTSPEITNKEQSQPTDKHADGQGDHNAEHSVIISKFPAVSVTKDWTDRLYWIFNGLLVVIGGFQIWVLIRQLKIINRQADIAERQEIQMAQAGIQTERIIAQMKETTERQLRAYVGVSRVFLDMTNPALPIGAVEIQNFGQTPAYKVRQWIGITPHSYPLSVKLVNQGGSLSSMAVLSRGVKHSSVVPLKKPFPQTAIPTIGSPQLTIYVFGGVTYEDVFGRERHITYRFIYGGPEGPKNITDGGKTLGTMSPDTNGNESD